MQFQVPQFIETEDKIVGPLTLKQFAYLAVAGAIGFISFFILKFFIWLILITLLGSIAAAFAFVKYNGRPLSVVFLSALRYSWGSKMYLWRREDAVLGAPKIKVGKAPAQKKSSLQDLWLKLSTGTKGAPKQPAKAEVDKSKYEIWRKLTGEKEVARRVDYR